MRSSRLSPTFFPRKVFTAVLVLAGLLSVSAVLAPAQSITQVPSSQSDLPQLTKSPQGKQDEAARAAVRSTAHHFDRVLIIVLENVDYEVASKDKSFMDLAAGGASFTNFHALFHPSYPNYLAMVAGTDYGIHHRGRLLADNQVNLPADAAHQTIADRLIAAGLEEGMTINGVSKAWGISRQLASRYAKETRGES